MFRLARNDMVKIRAEQIILTVLKSNIPPSARATLQSEDSVNAYSEKEKR